MLPLESGAAATSGGSGRRTRLARGRATAHTTTATHAEAGVLILNTALLGVVSSGGNSGVLGGVHAHRDPGEDTVRHGVTKVDVLHEGIDSVSLLGEDGVVGVGGQLLGVGGVRGGLLDFGDQILVEEDLADVRGGRGVQAGDGAVGINGGLVDGVSEH